MVTRLSLNSALIPCLLLWSSSGLFAVEVVPTVDYEQRVFSSEEDVELGETTDLKANVKFEFEKNTSLKVGFDTDPEKNPFDNKTSKIETLLQHRLESKSSSVSAYYFGVDLDIRLQDEGGISIGPDADSDDTFLGIEFSESFSLQLNPFNIGGRVGDRFFVDHVTRIFYVDGNPSFLSNKPLSEEEVAMKTIPGFTATMSLPSNLELSLGFGAAGFKYPATVGFDIETSGTSERWEVQTVEAQKAGLSWKPTDAVSLEIEHVGHSKPKETGSLLKDAQSVQLQYDSSVYVAIEGTQTKAGMMPYKLDSSAGWFEDTTPYRPVFSDFYGDKHSWIDQRDHALSLKLGFRVGHALPYIAFDKLGENFVFTNRDSAHRLRTADESKSHGGLEIASIGVVWSDGPLVLHPMVSSKTAKNEVFGSKSDHREDQLLRKLETKETVFTINVSYNL